MTFRIDRASAAEGLVLREPHVVAIELAEVELVAREVVQLLAQAEVEGITLRSCPAYVREWITRERESSSRSQ